jgi:hypothetical protein
MTEFITKEEAEKLAAELRIPILKYAAKVVVCSFEQFHEAINLALLDSGSQENSTTPDGGLVHQPDGSITMDWTEPANQQATNDKE